MLSGTSIPCFAFPIVKGSEYCGFPATTFFVVVFLVVLVSTVSRSFEVKKEINQFQSQAAYLVDHEPKDSIENAALTNKKIELNAWLYEVQWKQDAYGIFSFYNKDIQDLNPIQ